MDSGNTERSLGGELRLHAMVFAIAVRKDDDGTASSDEMGSCITVHGKKDVSERLEVSAKRNVTLTRRFPTH